MSSIPNCPSNTEVAHNPAYLTSSRKEAILRLRTQGNLHN